ncbi:MAG TPA: YkgJ family cysteine cluster protein [Planctomycetota bacterium]|nr:YkgJ family cysteine cluster protein [Planctomycetota bacterium]
MSNDNFITDDMLTNAPWYKSGVQFSCQPGCVRCCGGAPGDVFVSREEIDAIAAFMNLPVQEFEDSFVRHYSSGRMSLTERRNGDCILLNEKGCSVYSVRPKQCRDYPFWPEVMKSVFSWIREAERCPGINVGEHHPAPKLVEILQSQK